MRFIQNKKLYFIRTPVFLKIFARLITINYLNTFCYSPLKIILFEIFRLGRMTTTNKTKFYVNILLNLE